MITKEYLHQLINSNAEENRWGEINQLISEENREVIENFLTDLLIYNKDLFKNTIVLNLIYALAHIRNTESIETILKIGIEFKDNVSVTNEVLDAIGDILAGQEYNPSIRETIKTYLREIISNYRDNDEILSSVGYVLDCMSPSLNIKGNSTTYFGLSPEHLESMLQEIS